MIDSSTKELVYTSSGVNLLNPATVTQNYTITKQNGSWISGKSEDTNITSYISYDWKNIYTYSQDKSDSNVRYILAFDKNKKQIGYFDYRSIVSSDANFTFDITNFTFVTAEGDERTDEELAESVKYIRINYFNGATKVQLEIGGNATAYDLFDKPAIYYLYEKNGEYSVSQNKVRQLEDGRQRVLPVKTVIATYSESSSSSTDETTTKDVAKDKLIPSQFNQAIEIRINSDSKMFDFVNAKFGDQYQIINEMGSIDSVYTGKKISNKEKYTTLYFGKGRQNYTDKQQIKLRKRKYTEIYNQG